MESKIETLESEVLELMDEVLLAVNDNDDLKALIKEVRRAAGVCEYTV